MPDLDKLLDADISTAASRAAQPLDYAVVERRAAQRRRNRNALVMTATAAAVVLTVVGSLQVASSRGAAPSVPVERPTARSSPPAA